MKVGDAHLSYCLNVHPGQSVDEVLRAVRGPVRLVKQLVCPHERFGVGLRLSAEATRSLGDESTFEALQGALAEHGLYAFTVNAFPYGAFHGQPVKAEVYEPNWSRSERKDYTVAVAGVLARLMPEGVNGSISTVPLGYALNGSPDPGTIQRMASNVLDVVAALWRCELEQGKRIVLALEPEPDCLLQTTSDVIRVFKHHFFSDWAASYLAAQCGVRREAAVEICRRHLTVCLDACHAAVEFESPRELLEQLSVEGIAIGKVQLSSGLCVPECVGAKRAQLERFDEPVYLHQTVVQRPDGELVRYADLGLALEHEPAVGGEWRVHFHVPVHVQQYGLLSSTRRFLSDLLAEHRRAPISEHLEVETYTWDVLPDKGASLEHSIASELTWCLEQCR